MPRPCRRQTRGARRHARLPGRCAPLTRWGKCRCCQPRRTATPRCRRGRTGCSRPRCGVNRCLRMPCRCSTPPASPTGPRGRCTWGARWACFGEGCVLLQRAVDVVMAAW